MTHSEKYGSKELRMRSPETFLIISYVYILKYYKNYKILAASVPYSADWIMTLSMEQSRAFLANGLAIFKR